LIAACLTASEVEAQCRLGDICADGEGAARRNFLEIFGLCVAAILRQIRQRRMVAQPRRQINEKRRSKRLIQINRPRSNKPNRVDRLGKHGVHQY